MCLIVRSNGPLCPKEWFMNSVDHNPDGFGAMWFVASEKRVHALKMRGSAAEQWKAYEDLVLEGIPHAIHHRFSTHGNKTVAMCHPFRIASKDRDGFDLFMMHNGVISGLQTPVVGNSDTWHFVKDYLRRPLKKFGLAFLREPSVKAFISDFISTGNKLLFLDSQGVFTTINRKSGDEKDGFWLSNTYSLAGTVRWSAPQNTKPYSYNHGWPVKVGESSSSSAQLPLSITQAIPFLTRDKLNLLSNIQPSEMVFNSGMYSLVHRIFMAMTPMERADFEKDHPSLYSTYCGIRNSGEQFYGD